MKFTKNVKRCFASSVAVSLLLSISSISSISAASAASSPTLADDNLLVLLAPHANSANAQASLKNEAHASTLHDMHVSVDDYSILHVQPPSGQREQTLKSIQSMMATHPEIKSVSRNYLYHRLIHLSGGNNDPDFSSQWPLAAMRYTAAQAQGLSRLQRQPATITVLSQGQHPVAQGNELGAYIKQYNAEGNTVFREAVQGSVGGVEGDLDSSITGCLSNNGVLIAGDACFQPNVACLITSIRITESDSVSLFNIELGAIFALENQKLRRGPGPVNLSFGDDAVPLWNQPGMQAIGTSFLNQGDIFVLAAGDTPGDNVGVTIGVGQAALGSIVVVQASANDATNAMLLTEVLQGTATPDPYGAPGDVQPAVIDGVFNEGFLGSSFSAPLWCGAIAMVRSVNPSLSSAQANAIVLSTGTPMFGTSNSFDGTFPPVDPNGKVCIPAFDRAILSATGH